jgi:hypothetical protein
MRTKIRPPYMEFIILLILVCIGALLTIRYTDRAVEGFAAKISEQQAYDTLVARLKADTKPYCKVTEFMQNMLLEAYTAAKVSPKGEQVPGDTSTEANKKLMQKYIDVYNCKDDMAADRKQCAGVGIVHPDWQFIPCSKYTDLPAYDAKKTPSLTEALMNIPDNTPDRVLTETLWYETFIHKLQTGLDAGANPPSEIPGSANKEGFYDAGKCSPEAAAIRSKQLEQEKAAALAASCTMPTLEAEIDRVNGILNNKSMKQALEKCKALEAAAAKLQSDMDKLKAGNLYSWQQADTGPKKSYAQFQGGDNAAAFAFSVKQVKS